MSCLINGLGLVGAILLALCGLPQAIHSMMKGNSDGVSSLFIAMWLSGEVLVLAYVAITNPDLILMSNYVFNIVLVAIIAYYKVRRRR